MSLKNTSKSQPVTLFWVLITAENSVPWVVTVFFGKKVNKLCANRLLINTCGRKLNKES